MVRYWKASIEVLVEADGEGEACDAIAEGLRPMLRTFCDSPHESAWIDWKYVEKGHPEPYTGEGFEYAEIAP